MIYREVETSIYFASNTDRLLGDRKAWSDGNLVDILGAYVFDNQLIQVRLESSAKTYR